MNYKRAIDRAVAVWGNLNIKQIEAADIRSLVLGMKKADGKELSSKTRKNYRDALNTFWRWLEDTGILNQNEVPKIVPVKAVMSRRQVISLDEQIALVEAVKTLSYHRNPKIWLFFHWWRIYGGRVRPGEMRSITESDINLEAGIITIRKPKEGSPKIVPIGPEGVKEAREMMAKYPGFPAMRFFRSVPGEEGVAPNVPFNHKRLEKWWHKACDHLGVKYIAPYSCMKHSTVMALRLMGRTPEEIRSMTGHHTDESFGRYYNPDIGEIEQMFDQVRRAKGKTVAIGSGL
jgi:integrase